MDLLVNVGVSNRHVHLTEDLYNELFDSELTIKKKLNQQGQFASNQTVIIKGPKGEIYNVRVMGPCRKYNQVEISNRDARELGLNPPTRRSGDLNNSESITIVGPIGQKHLGNACIISNRHLHLNHEDAVNLNVVDNQPIKVLIDGPKGGEMDAFVKIEENATPELHIDTDDANAFQLSSNDKVVVRL